MALLPTLLLAACTSNEPVETKDSIAQPLTPPVSNESRDELGLRLYHEHAQKILEEGARFATETREQCKAMTPHAINCSQAFKQADGSVVGFMEKNTDSAGLTTQSTIVTIPIGTQICHVNFVTQTPAQKKSPEVESMMVDCAGAQAYQWFKPNATSEGTELMGVGQHNEVQIAKTWFAEQ